MSRLGFIDVEVYDKENNSWAQGKYLVHGLDDVLWTDDAEQAALYVKESIERLYKECKII